MLATGASVRRLHCADVLFLVERSCSSVSFGSRYSVLVSSSGSCLLQ